MDWLYPKANQKKYLVSGNPTDPLFFKKGKKKKKNGAWFSDGYALFLQRQFSLDVDCMSSKERWAWPRHSTPTDRPAVERDSRDTGNKVFLLVGLRDGTREAAGVHATSELQAKTYGSIVLQAASVTCTPAALTNVAVGS